MHFHLHIRSSYIVRLWPVQLSLCCSMPDELMNVDRWLWRYIMMSNTYRLLWSLIAIINSYIIYRTGEEGDSFAGKEYES